MRIALLFFFFFFNDTATTEIYTLSLHDALPISVRESGGSLLGHIVLYRDVTHEVEVERAKSEFHLVGRSEEHTSELQSLAYLVCRLLLEKKKKTTKIITQNMI